MTYPDIREAICDVCHKMWQLGWVAANDGNVSVKLPDGNFKVTGRIKDMIIRGGENLYPKEIEDFIYTHPKVSDVQVIGVPDKQYGEEAMACIIVKPGETLTEEEIRTYCLENMAKHKVPRYFDFVDGFVALPKKPGLGVDVNKELVLEENKNPHNWKNPVWRHADGSVAEW